MNTNERKAELMRNGLQAFMNRHLLQEIECPYSDDLTRRDPISARDSVVRHIESKVTKKII